MRQYSLNKIDRKKLPIGRPEIPIDWSVVDKYLISGCTGEEVAAVIGVHADTLYRRCELEKQTTFTVYAANKRSKGKSLLRDKQFEVAMDGDRTMLIWLGKAVLEQRETTDSNQNITKIVLGVSHDLASGRPVSTKTLSDSSHKGSE